VEPERIIPDDTEPGIVATHLARYAFARPRLTGLKVLDAGCGVGYGTDFLSAEASSVTGIDVSEETVAYARRRYGGPRTEFRVGDLHALDFPDVSFDAVCSFETLEHVEAPEQVLAELARVLRPSGTLFVSTPHALETTRAPTNPFHRVEWSAADFERLLGSHFAEVELFGQRRVQTDAHRLAQRLDVLGLRRRFAFLRRGARLLGTTPTAELTLDDVVVSPGVEGASEVVAVCTLPRR
jgi:SAM-dependent methyltransferase